MMAIVDQTLSPVAFSVDQDKTKSTGKDVLVLAPRLNEPVELNTYVTVIGEVVKFDANNAKVKDGSAGYRRGDREVQRQADNHRDLGHQCGDESTWPAACRRR